MTPAEFMLAERRAQAIRANVKTRNIHRTNNIRTDEYIVRIYGNLYKVNATEMKYLRESKTPDGIDTLKARIAASREPIQNIDATQPQEQVEAL